MYAPKSAFTFVDEGIAERAHPPQGGVAKPPVWPQKSGPRFGAPEGCALFLFDKGEAHIYVSAELPSNIVLEHERLHAAGYDHIGSTNMQRALER